MNGLPDYSLKLMYEEELKAVIRKLPGSVSEKELRLFLGDEAKKCLCF